MVHGEGGGGPVWRRLPRRRQPAQVAIAFNAVLKLDAGGQECFSAAAEAPQARSNAKQMADAAVDVGGHIGIARALAVGAAIQRGAIGRVPVCGAKRGPPRARVAATLRAPMDIPLSAEVPAGDTPLSIPTPKGEEREVQWRLRYCHGRRHSWSAPRNVAERAVGRPRPGVPAQQ